MEAFLIWLCVVAVAILLLAIILAPFIAAAAIVGDFVDLRRAGAPRPAMITWKRFLGVYFGGRRAGCVFPPLDEPERFAHIPVWLSWDIRWVNSGTGIGRIENIIQNSGGLDLLLRLSEPVSFSPDEGDLREVIFEPRNPNAFIYRNGFSSIYGTLKTPNESERIAVRGRINCELVTLVKPRG